MKGLVTACWLMTMSFGDILNGFVTPYYEQTIRVFGANVYLSPALYFSLFGLLMAPVLAAFLAVAQRFNAEVGREHGRPGHERQLPADNSSDRSIP